ncbi:hypothetical protein AL537_03115 [Vibrio diabolicus]|nr:hypothetical protein AL537_03115 [Vibrio diabolicus]
MLVLRDKLSNVICAKKVSKERYLNQLSIDLDLEYMQMTSISSIHSIKNVPNWVAPKSEIR